MKLVIQVPCLNESDSLAITIRELPRRVPGFDLVEWLVIDDGSTDGTAELAILLGVDHVIRHPANRGLAAAFMTGLDACLRLGADVIVNTDADNQYAAADIPLLTAPILASEADMVVGGRPINETRHFSWTKKKLQHLGSWAVRIMSGTRVSDAPSGFRAISRDTAMRLNVYNPHTYTLETIMQAGLSKLRVISVPIRTNRDLRPSRLMSGMTAYVARAALTMVRVFITYRPLLFFSCVTTLFVVASALLGLRASYLSDNPDAQLPSLVAAASAMIIATLTAVGGIIADLVASNRKLLERMNFRFSQQKLTSGFTDEVQRSPVAAQEP